MSPVSEDPRVPSVAATGSGERPHATPAEGSPDPAPGPEPTPMLGWVGRRWGGGHPTFVVLHGLGVASRMTTPVARELAEDGTVLAPDLPGFGAAAVGEPDVPPDVDALGRSVADRVGRLSGARVLIGCSVGAQIALHAAAQLGPALDALVLVSPTVDRHRRRLRQQLARWPLEMATQPWMMRRIVFEDQRAAGPRRVLRLFATALHDRPEHIVDRVTCPALVVRGTRDPLVGVRWAEELARGLPRGRLVVLAGRHAMTFTEPVTLAQAVRDFLDRDVDLSRPAEVTADRARPSPTDETPTEQEPDR
jgi:pimeloyl-ACP methyl ester carboxylesterase